MSTTVRRERNSVKVFQTINGTIHTYIDMFDRTRREFWTHAQILAYRSDWVIGTEWYAHQPIWAQRTIGGSFDTLMKLWWRDLKWTHVYDGARRNAFSTDPARDKSKFNPYFDDKYALIDTAHSSHCYLYEGKFIPIHQDMRDFDSDYNIISIID